MLQNAVKVCNIWPVDEYHCHPYVRDNFLQGSHYLEITPDSDGNLTPAWGLNLFQGRYSTIMTENVILFITWLPIRYINNMTTTHFYRCYHSNFND